MRPPQGDRLTSHIRRLVAAFLLSIAINAVLLAISFGINPQQQKLSTKQGVAIALLRPAESIAELLAGDPTVLILRI